MQSAYKLITCMLTKPVAIQTMTKLKEQKGIITANSAHARGTSSQTNFAMKTVEILTVLVEAKEAEAIFIYLYEELKLGEPHHGMIYQEAVSRSTQYSLPDLKE